MAANVDEGMEKVKLREMFNLEVLQLLNENKVEDDQRIEEKKMENKETKKEEKDAKKPQPSKDEEMKDLCNRGDVVGKRFCIRHKLCDGGFGQLYVAFDTIMEADVAVKCEKLIPHTYNVEEEALKMFQGNIHCPTFYEAGCEDARHYTFVAMQLLGRSLSQIRKSCSLAPKRLSLNTSYRVIVQCIEAVEGLHTVGYLHRDVKPSNFVIGLGIQQRIVYMIDYGLCRYFRSRDGNVKAARLNAGFRGTVRYASLNAHRYQDLSRRDDMISLFYSLVEMITGQLPWRTTNEKDEVSKMKVRFSPENLCHHMQPELQEAVAHLTSLKYAEKPKYEMLSKKCQELASQYSSMPNELFDWQVTSCSNLLHWPYNRQRS